MTLDLERIAEQLIASAPGVLVLAAMFWRAIHRLERATEGLAAADLVHAAAITSNSRKLSRLCARAGQEVTGRHSVPPTKD